VWNDKREKREYYLVTQNKKNVVLNSHDLLSSVEHKGENAMETEALTFQKATRTSEFLLLCFMEESHMCK